MTAGPPFLTAEWRHPGSIPSPDGGEAAILVREWGYTHRRKRGGTFEYRVAHPAWRIWRATESSVDADLAGLYGQEWADQLIEPDSVFLADGSPVVVHAAARL